ncbi:hypothetical protein E2320_005343 [Naja naja]|nr:hypothetical protein E2320_005343 [Naja naja]
MPNFDSLTAVFHSRASISREEFDEHNFLQSIALVTKSAILHYIVVSFTNEENLLYMDHVDFQQKFWISPQGQSDTLTTALTVALNMHVIDTLDWIVPMSIFLHQSWLENVLRCLAHEGKLTDHPTKAVSFVFVLPQKVHYLSGFSLYRKWLWKQMGETTIPTFPETECCCNRDAVEETKPSESALQEEAKEEESKADQENA